MELQIRASYLGLVRDVSARKKEKLTTTPDITIGDLLQFSVTKHRDPFQKTAFQTGRELRATACVGGNEATENKVKRIKLLAVLPTHHSSPWEGDAAKQVAFESDRVSRTVSLTLITDRTSAFAEPS